MSSQYPLSLCKRPVEQSQCLADTLSVNYIPPSTCPGCHRKAKQSLLSDGIAGLQKKVKKGRGVSKELIEERQRRVSETG